jgi:hypothetical protein
MRMSATMKSVAQPNQKRGINASSSGWPSR